MPEFTHLILKEVSRVLFFSCRKLYEEFLAKIIRIKRCEMMRNYTKEEESKNGIQIIEKRENKMDSDII